MLLSTTAERMYWTARYLERIENTARPGTIDDAFGCSDTCPMVQTVAGDTTFRNRSSSKLLNADTA